MHKLSAFTPISMQVLCSITSSQPDSCAAVVCRRLVTWSEANVGAFMTTSSKMKLSLPLAGISAVPVGRQLLYGGCVS